MNPYTKIRQSWLLEYFWQKHPLGIASTHACPSDAPAGIGMTNIRGLERRGLIHEPASGLFYLTEYGVTVCQELFGVHGIKQRRAASQTRLSIAKKAV